MGSFLSDLRLSTRRLFARPAATLVAVVTLGAGIGAVSAMYLLFKAASDDLPRVPEAERIGRVFIADPLQRERRIPPSPNERDRWLASSPRGVTLASVTGGEVLIEPGGRTVQALRISGRYFDVAAVRPEVGRTFAPGERAVVVSRRLWELLPAHARRLGETLVVDGQPQVLVGVMEPSFWMPARGIDAWLPETHGTSEGWMQVLVRLGHDTTAEQAGAELSPVVQHLRGGNYVAEIRLLAADAAVRARTTILMLVGPALLVLLAVCANVSALLLGDVYRRRQELAVRAALGAGRWHLAREVFCDALGIAGIAGAVALAAAYWSVQALRAAIAPVSADVAAMIPPFTAVAPVALGAAMAAVGAVGYAPALFASRVNIVTDLTGAGAPLIRRGHYSAADLLLVLQVAMATGLVLWTIVVANVFDRVSAIPAHVPADRVWAIAVSAPAGTTRIAPDVVRLILDQAGRAPAVEAAGLAERAPARRLWIGTTAGGVTTCSAWLERVSGDYFEAHRFPLQGSAPRTGGAVLNEPAMRRCGQPIAIRDESHGSETLRVTGSVDDRLMGAGIPRPGGPPTVFAPLTAPGGRQLTLKILLRSSAASDARAVRDELARNIPAARFGEPTSLRAEHQRGFGAAVLIGRLLSVLAALALLLGIVGLHAAIAQALATRTREIGVRMALGAARRDIVRVAVGHHGAPALIGTLLGGGVAVMGLFLLRTDDAALIRELALLTAQSPAAWAGLASLLIGSCLLSASVPVLRAVRLDPSVVLRQE